MSQSRRQPRMIGVSCSWTLSPTEQLGRQEGAPTSPSSAQGGQNLTVELVPLQSIVAAQDCGLWARELA